MVGKAHQAEIRVTEDAVGSTNAKALDRADVSVCCIDEQFRLRNRPTQAPRESSTARARPHGLALLDRRRRPQRVEVHNRGQRKHTMLRHVTGKVRG
jgi:hypothetical protein